MRAPLPEKLRPIVRRILTSNPSIRIEWKPDPAYTKLEKGGKRLRLEIWTPFLHVKPVDNHPRLFEFCAHQTSVQIAWFKLSDNGGVLLQSTSPLVVSENVTDATIETLLIRLRTGSNWTVPW